MHMRERMVCCPLLFQQLPVMRLLGPDHVHLLQDTELFSLDDLEELSTTGNLVEILKAAVETAGKHIVEECASCQADAGSHCPVCRDPGLLYAFNILAVSQCGVCNTVYHRAVSRGGGGERGGAARACVCVCVCVCRCVWGGAGEGQCVGQCVVACDGGGYWGVLCLLFARVLVLSMRYALVQTGLYCLCL